MKRVLVVVVPLLLTGCAASSVDDLNLQTGTANNLAGPMEPQNKASDSLGTLATSPAPPKNTVPDTRIADRAAKASAAKIAAVSEPGSNAYKIGPRDVLDISVFKVPELSKQLRVSENGSVNYPLVGEIKAAGRTARDFELQLARELKKKYLQNPQVTVAIKEYNSQRITLEGTIKKPGVYPIQGHMSLLQSVAMGGGMDKMSDDTVVVFRHVNGKRSAAKFDISEIRAGNADDPQLVAGDVVVAGKSAFKEGMNNVLTALRFTSVFALF